MGLLIKGNVEVTGSGITLQDCHVERYNAPIDETSAYYLIEAAPGAINNTVRNISLDGKNSMWGTGLGGATYNTGWLVEKLAIQGMGLDAIKAFKDSVYQDSYMHSFRAWNEAIDGVYDPDIHPHTDGIQVQRPGNIVRRNWIVNTTAANGTSAVIVHNGTDETVVNVTLTENYLDGGSSAVHTHPQNPDVNDPGDLGYPHDLIYTNNWFGRTSRFGQWSDTGVPSAGITRSGNTFADSGAPVQDPTLIVAP